MEDTSKKGNFLDNYFEFIADPEGLTREEIIQGLKDDGIDVDLIIGKIKILKQNIGKK